ncbi:MAG: hypothetical protein ACJAWL_002241 [Motiliproteus sp.]|jgi:hypothetical protein
MSGVSRLRAHQKRCLQEDNGINEDAIGWVSNYACCCRVLSDLRKNKPARGRRIGREKRGCRFSGNAPTLENTSIIFTGIKRASARLSPSQPVSARLSDNFLKASHTKIRPGRERSEITIDDLTHRDVPIVVLSRLFSAVRLSACIPAQSRYRAGAEPLQRLLRV